MTANAPLGASNLVTSYLTQLQAHIVESIEAIDGGIFTRDAWSRGEHGEGLSCVLENSTVIERGGVNFSHVHGKNLPPTASGRHPELAGRDFEAMGVSLVLHPRNPFAPTVHMNVRFFIAHSPNNTESDPTVWWFGGGMDLTPCYGFADDAKHFHQMCADALAPFGKDKYPTFKAWCDDYFYLKHRQEARGIGGIFFDDINTPDFDTAFALMQSVGDHFLPAYLPLLKQRHVLPYGDNERDFQAYRRGRYVEFNLVYDRGTLFGLQSGGRTESILVSMPPTVIWRYQWQPLENSPESLLYRDFLPKKQWLSDDEAFRKSSIQSNA